MHVFACIEGIREERRKTWGFCGDGVFDSHPILDGCFGFLNLKL